MLTSLLVGGAGRLAELPLGASGRVSVPLHAGAREEGEHGSSCSNKMGVDPDSLGPASRPAVAALPGRRCVRVGWCCLSQVVPHQSLERLCEIPLFTDERVEAPKGHMVKPRRKTQPCFLVLCPLSGLLIALPATLGVQ